MRSLNTGGLAGNEKIEAALNQGRDYRLEPVGENAMRFTLLPAYLDGLEWSSPGYWTFKINFDNGDTFDYAVFTVLVAPPLPPAYTRGTQSEIDYGIWTLQSPEMGSPFAPSAGPANLNNREYTAWWYNDYSDRLWDSLSVR